MTIGIDVGAPSKGYHAVALQGHVLKANFHSCDPIETVQWCVAQAADVIAIDAPCRWRVNGGPPRAAELALAADRISCFATPTEEKATGHAFYTWMHAGHGLYAALAGNYPLYLGGSRRSQVSIETYPQAVACALAGEIVSAKQKNAVRRDLLRRAGIDPTPLRNIDEVDAALCAYAALCFTDGRFKPYGDAAGGFIIVPSAAVTITSTHPATNDRPVPDIARNNASREALTKILSLLPMLSPGERLQLISRLEELVD